MSISTSKLLEKVPDFSTAKNKVISENLANVNTVNYKRKDINFRDFLEDASNSEIRSTNPKHFAASEVKLPGTPDFNVINNKEQEADSGLNNVDADKEMAEMAQNSIMFKFAAHKLKSHYTTLQKVIKGEPV